MNRIARKIAPEFSQSSRPSQPWYTALLTIVTLSVLLGTAATSQGQTYNVLYNFSSASGDLPEGQIAMDKSGNIYGTTIEGGTYNDGTVYELSPPSTAGGAWTETVLYSFGSGADAGGYYPVGGITLSAAGNLYGTTSQGGDPPCRCGTVFELKPPTVAGGAWGFRNMHHFAGPPSDGSNPEAPLTIDSSGNVYGTTFSGGLYENSSTESGGIAFKLTPAGSGWTETILWNFGGAGDASYPMAGLTPDSSGNYYGSTLVGGSNGIGALFQLKPPSGGGTAWMESVLYSFPSEGTSAGDFPAGSLVIDSHGNLFGTAGGSIDFCCGSVFELKPPVSGSTWTFKALYTFTFKTNGYVPIGLTMDSAGQNLYGVTEAGNRGFDGPVAFKLSPPTGTGRAWGYSVLHSFSGKREQPRTPPIVDASGNVYGATFEGGANDLGLFYQITP